MKINKIKKKLKELFGGDVKDNSDNIASMTVLMDLLKKKENKIKAKLKVSANDDDIQELKRKLKLIKKQLHKAGKYITSLKDEDTGK